MLMTRSKYDKRKHVERRHIVLGLKPPNLEPPVPNRRSLVPAQYLGVFTRLDAARLPLLFLLSPACRARRRK